MKNFKYILGLFLGLGALGGLTWVLGSKLKSKAKIDVLCPQKDENEVFSTVQGICSEGSCVADTLKQELAQQHDQLLEIALEAFPIDQNEWDKAINQFNAAKSSDTLLVKNPIIKNNKGDHELVKKARKILASYDINPAAVTIKVTHRPNTKTNAASYQGFVDNKVIHELELNIPQLSQHPADVQEAIIRHEIMHLLNYDPLERAYLEVTLMQNGITVKQFMKEPALLDLYKHQEFRADLLAACHSIDTAQSFQKDFEHYIQTCPQDQCQKACITHPSDAQRHKAVTALLGYMEAENKIKLA